jgi:protein-tyrosine phosphatase
MAAAAGTTDLVCTPHANTEYRFEPPLIAERLRELEAGVDGAIRLYAGCDFHLSYDNIQDAIANPRKYTINGNCYLLVEFSDLLIFKNTAEIFGRLRDAGMVPIVTHPERNALLRQRLEEIEQWVQEGALLQVTGSSLLGQFGRRAAEFSRTLLDRGLVHFIASDGHDLEHRPPTMNDAHVWLVKNYSQRLADILCTENPRATLSGAPIHLPGEDEYAKPKKWYQVWR